MVVVFLRDEGARSHNRERSVSGNWSRDDSWLASPCSEKQMGAAAYNISSSGDTRGQIDSEGVSAGGKIQAEKNRR